MRARNIYKLLTELRAYDGVLNCYAFGEVVHLSFKNDSSLNEKHLLEYVQNKEHAQTELKQVTPTIEDCFIRLLNN